MCLHILLTEPMLSSQNVIYSISAILAEWFSVDIYSISEVLAIHMQAELAGSKAV
jgi:hypothetical protein